MIISILTSKLFLVLASLITLSSCLSSFLLPFPKYNAITKMIIPNSSKAPAKGKRATENIAATTAIPPTTSLLIRSNIPLSNKNLPNATPIPDKNNDRIKHTMLPIFLLLKISPH